jgi:hypothetical protein
VTWRTAGLLALAFVSKAHADPPASKNDQKGWATVRVRAPDCETAGFPANAFLRLLDVELSAEHLRRAKNDSAAENIELTVTIEPTVCDVTARDLTVRLHRGETESEIKRFVDFGDVAMNARPRALALALVEQIRQALASPGPAAKPPLPGPDESSSFGPPAGGTGHGSEEPALRNDPPPRLGNDVAAAGVWRIFFGNDTSMLGARLAFSSPLASTWLRWQADITGLVTNVDDPLGNADVSYLAGGVALIATTRENPALSLGPRIEMGVGSVRSHGEKAPVTLRDGNQPIVLASLIAGMRASIDAHWASILAVEGGVTPVGLTVLADERTIGALSGLFATVHLGFAFAF